MCIDVDLMVHNEDELLFIYHRRKHNLFMNICCVFNTIFLLSHSLTHSLSVWRKRESVYLQKVQTEMIEEHIFYVATCINCKLYFHIDKFNNKSIILYFFSSSLKSTTLVCNIGT